MNKKFQKQVAGQRTRRARRVRAKISGTSTRPRLAVHRGLTTFSAQLIDDSVGKTIAAVTQKELKKKKPARMEVSTALGKLMAEKAAKAGIKQVVFDRRSNKYHGRVKAFADAAREAGLQF